MMQEDTKHSLEYDFVISGIGMQNLYEGNFLSLSRTEVEYHGQVLKNCLHLKYHIDVVKDISLSEQEFINRVVVREGDIFLQVLALVFSRPSHIFFHQAKLDDEIVEPEFPTRKIPSGLY
nr:hypothetical protein [Candidatus Brocadiales bacterium]